MGYEKEGFRGHQYLLEEGEYQDWRVWGGHNSELRSVRLIKAVSFSEETEKKNSEQLSLDVILKCLGKILDQEGTKKQIKNTFTNSKNIFLCPCSPSVRT